MAALLFGIFLALTFLFVGRTVWRRWKYDLHKIPSLPGLPILGHTLSVQGNRGESEVSYFTGMAWKALGKPKIFKMEYFQKTLICIRDSDQFKKIMTSKPPSVVKSPFILNFLTTVLGNDPQVHCLLTTGEVDPYVKAIRQVYTRGLQQNTLKAAMPKLHDILDKMSEIIDAQRKNGPIDFQELCVRMTMDAIGVLALDTTLGALDNTRPVHTLLIEAGCVSQQRAYNLIQTWIYTLCPWMKGAQEQRATLDGLTAEWEAVTKEILAREDPPAGESPLWHSLRTMVDPRTGKRIDDKHLVAEVATVVIGGTDTTGHQLSCILAVLASHPRVTERLLLELKEHGLDGPECRNLTLKDLSDLVYLSAVVKEGIRVSHITISAVERKVCEDMTILGFRIPKGASLHFPGLRYMNSESDWVQPEAFRPERWLVADDMSEKYYFPFSCGARNCVGQTLAVLEMRVAIARLIQRFRFSPVRPIREVLEDCVSGVVIQAAGGLWLRVEPRT